MTQMVSQDAVISVKNVSKKYKLYSASIDRMKEALNPFKKKYHKDFYALKDISFQIKKGETVGIIGKNGSGKSTLLKIVTGVLTQSSGDVEIHGKVSALLELGAGFNPEYTGMENIYFQGNLMGYTEEEVNAKVDDILNFADIGDFIYQPVKMYSSGMFARLAFAIAINVEPDILIVDEALSVGDIAFQNKCIRKIKELNLRGCTTLFVSHDLSTLQVICTSAIWIQSGVIQKIGDPIEVCLEYKIAQVGESVSGEIKKDFISQHNTGYLWIKNVRMDSEIYQIGDDVCLNYTIKALQNLDNVVLTVSVYTDDGDWIIGKTSYEDKMFCSFIINEQKQIRCVFPNICLAPGKYKVFVGACSEDFSECYALTESPVFFMVRASYPTWGKIIYPCKWTIFDV